MTKVRQQLLIHHALILALLLSTKSFGATLPENNIKVVTEYLEPYQIQNPDGTIGGFSTEVVLALFKEAKRTADISVMPWARAYEMAKLQTNTMIYSIAHTKHRDSQFHWVGSLKKERLYFWGLKKHFPHPISTLALLKGYKVAASRNSNVAQYLVDEKFFNIYQLIKEEQNMLMLYRERVDLIVATELTLRNRAKRLGLDFNNIVKIKEAKELNNDLSIAFSKNTDAELFNHFKLAFDRIENKGTIQNLRRKWQIPNQ